MKRDNSRSRLVTRRAALLAGGQVALLGALASRMYYLQVVEAPRYVTLSDENRVNIRLLAPPRGRVLDRFGSVMAGNAPTYRIVMVAEQAGDPGATLDAIALLVPLTDNDRHRVMRELQRKHRFVPVVVRENLSWEEMARIEVNTLELPGVSVEQGLTRYYPFGDLSSHVVGYVAAVSDKEINGGDPLLELPDFRIGKNGIEKAYDLELRGTAGTSQVEVNALGRVVRELAREEGMAGQEVVLTLDMALQDFAAKRCAAEESVACAVMDAWTGDLLAMVSWPGYDPAAFARGLTGEEWRDLVSNPRHPLNDKVIGGAYAPGSTFKPMVALAALDAGVITPETRVGCSGQYNLGDAVFHCWKHGGHGSMNLRDGIKHSCDCYFFEVARRTGIDRIAAMARRFGLGQLLGIDLLGEHAGLIPDSSWKKATFGVSWQQGETLSCGIGQSYVTATPLQLATMAARLATGRQVVPRLVREAGVMTDANASDASDFAKLDVSPKDLRMVQDGMYAVVNEQGGTAYAARVTDPALAMCGKSGTSQVRHITAAEREHGLLKGLAVPWKDRDHALFISFAPAANPRYVCACIVEHGGQTGGGGSAVAAPICRDILIEAQKRDPARRVPPEPFAVASLEPR